MSLESDFTVSYTAKTVTHSSGTEVFTVLAFFQWLATKFAAEAQMDDDYAFVSDTPQVYRWVNAWDMGDDNSYKYLKAGAVESADAQKLYSNLYTIGSQFRNSMIYIVQSDAELTPWWSPGNIDVVIKVKSAGTLIDGGKVMVMSRDTDGLYDHNEADLSAGGRNPVGINTFEDGNYKTTGDIYLDVAAITEVRAISGNTVANPTVVTTAAAHNLETGNIVTISGSNSTPIIDGTYTVTVISPTTFSVPVNVTVAGTAGSVTTAFDIGNFAYGNTSTASGRIQYIDTTNGYLYLCQVEGTFQTTEVIKERSSRGAGNLGTQTTNHATVAEYTVIKGYDNIKAVFVQRKFEGGTVTGTFIVGEVVNQAVSAWAGKFAGVVSNVLYMENTSGTPTGTNQLTGVTSGATYTPTSTAAQTTINKDLNNGAGVQPYNCVADCAGRTVLQIYQYLKYITNHNSAATINGDAGEEYRSAKETDSYTDCKQAPFGTFAGGVLFGARGIWIEDYAVASFQLIDADGDQQLPPNYQKALVSHANLSGCRILIACRSGASIIKNQYTISSVTTNSITCTANIDANKCPQSGSLRCGDTKYTYTSFAGTIFSGVSPDPTGQTGDLYVPQLDVLADATSEESANIILAAAFDVKTRVRKYGYKDYTMDTSFPTIGLAVTPILATDPQAS